ncbi:DNA-binding transcriptional response regulator, NtrC family, contains REC, AAA-type ATPase, and a Fis-type DNA-binding domains [Microbulbifer donghaiensis]|uniref:DNA-binding transcriptional response regulator, NtrC family, contains REC, AAA-type ATPase, and a Fis-type DNA-binding domains n=1 Tax=Microbulbifer donghaiensis TaxID=494016 RepID=A0A1M4YL49_9GAMM|nr:sigma-54 dependent transcriptional regulator [Microbulbifer donghaiensis]SHF06484.1 DNA-binding transcriptional response regulator, NtrC family, contains REC, AAA-type ATPase, and a Fis-type DNA-binding domains [Microbulbifer donghaiensis]
MSHILIVEDEAIIRTALRKLLERHRYKVSEAGSVREATTKYRLNDFDLIISDLRLPGAPGTDLLKLAGDVPVLIMTSYASLRSAVDSMRMGAADYIAKPFDHDEMIATVRRVIGKAEQSRAQAPAAREQGRTIAGMIGDSPVMRDLYSRIHKVAPTDATVLVHGETGTGKELVARAIHEESRRAGKPLISVNCAAIPETLIEAELFGHEKGAFTGAQTAREGLVAAADGGTLFLDEIGELPLEAQARLLRVLQEGEVRPIGAVESRKVDVRLVAATHRNLRQLAAERKFREDLYYRINVVQMTLAPLRERGKDVLAIAEHLLEKFCAKVERPTLKLSPEAVQAVTTYTWPGNVRELENAIQRAVILTDDDSREIDYNTLDIDLDLVPIEEADPERLPRSRHTDPREDLSLEDYFARFVIEHQDTMSETELAKKLGVSRKCLWERRQKLGIPRKKSRRAATAEA